MVKYKLVPHCRKPEILFFTIPSGLHGFSSNFGVGYIQALLKENNINSAQLVPVEPSNLTDLAEIILKINPGFVGFSIYDEGFKYLGILAKTIKNANKNLKIICGGPTATFNDKLILSKIPEIDVCVRYEGEYTTKELLQGFESKNDLYKIKGISFLDRKEYIRTKDRDLTDSDDKHLDILPSPYLTKIFKPGDLWPLRVMSSRGCSHNCTYCVSPKFYRGKIRFHSVERVISELDYIAKGYEKKGVVPSILFSDDSFTANKERVKKICKEIIKRKIKLNIGVLCRIDLLDEKLLLLMKKAGFTGGLDIGLETASFKIMKNIDKSLSKNSEGYGNEKTFLKTLKKNVSFCKKIKLHITVNIMFGLPGETKKEALETINFVNELDPDLVLINYLKIYRGTRLFDECHEYGIRLKKSPYVLPYEIDYLYDVKEMPKYCIKGSITEDFYKKLRIALLFNGRKSVYISHKYPLFIFNGFYPGKGKVFKWLNKTAPINGNLFILNKEKRKRLESTVVKNVIKFFVPSNIEFVYSNKINKKDISSTIYPMRPLKELNKYGASKMCVYKIQDRGDMEFLINIKKEVLSKIDKENCNILDICKWSCTECPAISLNRLIIEADDSLKPCFSGDCIGKIGKGLDELKIMIGKIKISEEKKRGCANCPIKNKCSKCLFPKPFSVKEFCGIMKNNSLETKLKYFRGHLPVFVESEG